MESLTNTASNQENKLNNSHSFAVTSQDEKLRLNSKHYEQCTVNRGLLPEWIEINCRSVDISSASELLGYTAKSSGIWLEGTNYQGQLRPDKPWRSDDNKNEKAPKYRSPRGEYDVMLPIHPVISNYWDDLEALKLLCYTIDGHPCLVTTEGFFKAIAGCSHDLPTIALLGVEMGLTPASADPQGKRYLVPGLEKFARAGFGFIHAFDADCATNSNVVMAQRKLVNQIKKFKVPQYIVTGLWEVDESFQNKNKGMDDYIMNHGADNFKREILAKAVNIERWEKLFESSGSYVNQQKITPKIAMQILADRYRHEWKYDAERQVWRRWNGKIWEAEQELIFTQVVYRALEEIPNINYGYFSFIENTVRFLKSELVDKHWQTFNRMEWIAFNDCVYEVKTGKTHPHAPGFGFISVLEHNFPKLVAIDPASSLLDQLRINAPNFYAWAMYSQKGDPLKVMKLLAIVNGVIKFRFVDLQMFVHLQGVPGSGKGTYARLLEKVVGKPNHTSAKLHKLGDDNVIAAIIDKQLVICPDEKKRTCDFSGLLSLTGGDNIPYIAKYKPQANGKFYGTIVVISNSNPFVGDVTGIDRRLSLVTFDESLPIRDTDVENKMQGEVPELTALALRMPDQQVTNLIKGEGDAAIPDFKRQQWLHKTENDSVALFMEEMLIPASPDKFVMLGGKGDDARTLYGAYIRMCDENNSKSLFTKNNFRGHLLELCREMGWHSVREARQGNGWRIYGVLLREVSDTSSRISDRLGECRECRECKPGVDPNPDLKPLFSKESVGNVDNLMSDLLSKENQISHQLRQENSREGNIPSSISREENSHEENVISPMSHEENNREGNIPSSMLREENSHEGNIPPPMSCEENSHEENIPSPMSCGENNREENVTSPMPHEENNREENVTSPMPHEENNREENITSPIVYTPTHSSQGEDLRSAQPEKQVYTAYTETDAATTELSNHSPSLLEQMLLVWDTQAVLGKLVLSSSETELETATAQCTLSEIAYIKEAANSAWRPGLNRDADYMGKRVEIMQAGQSREITVKTQAGSLLKVKRGNLRPWLGL
jgi:putative DNA primase/helicase